MLIICMYLNKKHKQKEGLDAVSPNQENALSCIPHGNRSQISGKSSQFNFFQNLGQESKFVTIISMC